MSSTSAIHVFGYVLLSDHDGMAEYSALAGSIGTFAQAHGYCLRGIFVDQRGRSDESSFQALLRAVRSGKATVLVVPDFGHLAHLPCLSGADVRTMTRYIRAQVVSIADQVGQEPVPPSELAVVGR
jgi:hypothetical protein